MKARWWILSIAFVALALITHNSAWAQPALEVGSPSGARGATVIVPVSLTDNGTAVALQFDLQFSAGTLDVGTLTNGPALSPHVRTSAKPSSGVLRVLVTPPNPPVSPLPALTSGVQVYIPVTISSTAAPGNYPLTLANVVFADASAGVVTPGTLTSGQVMVLAPNISVSPGGPSFVFPGANGGSSSSQAFTISNTGTSDLTVSAVALTGMNANQFGQANNCSTVTPENPCSITVTFTPTSQGVKSAILTIASNDPATPSYTISLRGTGSGPRLEVHRVLMLEDFSAGIPETWLTGGAWTQGPSGSSCGSQAIGLPFEDPWAIVDSSHPSCPSTPDERLFSPVFDASSCSNATLLMTNQFNPGLGSLARVSTRGSSGEAWFEVVSMTADEGPVWRETDLATLVGKQEGELAFEYSAGNGFWAIDNVWVLCQPSNLEMASPLALSSLPQVLFLRNTGTADLLMGTLSLEGTDPSHFKIQNDQCSGQTLTPQEGCAAEVVFSPLSDGDKSAKLSIPSNESGNPAEVVLTGKVVDFLLDMGAGTIGTELVLTGSQFGTKKGKVTIGTSALKVLEWENGRIRGLMSKAMVPGTYPVTVLPKEPKGAPALTDGDPFAIKAPEIYWVTPDGGSVGTTGVVKGKFFGMKKGKVYIGAKAAKAVLWTMDPTTGIGEIRFLVPKGLPLGTYDLKVVNTVGTGTAVNGFTIK